MEIGKYNLCITVYKKVFESRKIWLVGATFAISFLIPFIIAAIEGTLLSDDVLQQGYLEDFPAVFSIGIGLPLLVLFLAHYSERLPKVLKDIVSEGTVRIGEKEYRGIIGKYERRFNSKWSIMFLIPAVVLQPLWVIPLMNDTTLTWAFSVSSSGNESLNAGGFYYVFLCALYLYLVLYIIFYFALMTVLLWRFAGESEVMVKPLHPDDCGGLSKIGSLGLLTSYPIFLLGIGIAAILLSDKYVHGHQFFSMPIHYPMVIAYFIIAPLLFFLPLYTFKRPMKRAKDKSLAYFSELFESKYQQLPIKIDANSRDSVHKILTELATINTSYDLAKKMPVWPFNLKLIERFSAILISPFLMIALPWILEKYV